MVPRVSGFRGLGFGFRDLGLLAAEGVEAQVSEFLAETFQPTSRALLAQVS